MTQVVIQIPVDLKPFIDCFVMPGLFSYAAILAGNLLDNLKALKGGRYTSECALLYDFGFWHPSNPQRD